MRVINHLKLPKAVVRHSRLIDVKIFQFHVATNESTMLIVEGSATKVKVLELQCALQKA